MQKRKVWVIASIVLFSVLANSQILTADAPPFPGLPSDFWGTVKNQKGEDIADGTIITAIVDNESYYTTVMNGLYGWNETYQSTNPPFFAEDPDNDNEGKIIKFYVGGIYTDQTAIFKGGFLTRLNLTIDDGSSSGSSNGGGSLPPNGGPSSSSNKIPNADANGPYFGSLNRTILLDGIGSKDTDGYIVNYTWDFGDGTIGYGIKAYHIYSLVGNYSIKLKVTDNDGAVDNDTTTVFILEDSDNDGWTDEEEYRYKSDPYNSSSFPKDTDNDYLPDVIDDDDDGDGLLDSEENMFGSSSSNPNDVVKIEYGGNVFFFIDTNKDGISDLFYDREHNINTTIEESEVEGKFYVDSDGNGSTWEYIFDSNGNTVSLYGEKDESDESNSMPVGYIIIIAVVVVLALIICFLYIYKKGGKK